MTEKPTPTPSAPKKYWLGSIPDKCDICGSKLTHKMIDGRTSSGQWGLLDLKCHASHGVGLGTGKGQLYEKQADGQWLKIQG